VSAVDLEMLRELAESLKWPRWFDTGEGEEYAEAVRPRLLELVGRLSEAKVCPCGAWLRICEARP
jgi:hypothetical protein